MRLCAPSSYCAAPIPCMALAAESRVSLLFRSPSMPTGWIVTLWGGLIRDTPTIVTVCGIRFHEKNETICSDVFHDTSIGG